MTDFDIGVEKGRQEAKDIIEKLYELVISHHESDVRKEGQFVCPACSKPENYKLMVAAWNLMQKDKIST